VLGLLHGFSISMICFWKIFVRGCSKILGLLEGIVVSLFL